MQITISELKQYLQCPRSYKLREIDGVELINKTLSACKTAIVRKVVAEIHSGAKKPCDYTKEAIGKICEQMWQEEASDPKVDQAELSEIVVNEKKNGTPAITKGERILENIKTWIFEYSREEMDAEVLYNNLYFQTTIADVTFCGFIDQIRKVNDSLQILIFSTGSQTPHPMFLGRDFVAFLYSHALWQGCVFPQYPDLSEEIRIETIPTVYVYHFPYLERYQKKTGKYKKGDRKGNPLVGVTRTKRELVDFEYELLYIVSGMQQEFFPKMPKIVAGCTMCAYAHACQGSLFSESDTSFDIEEFEQAQPEQSQPEEETVCS